VFQQGEGLDVGAVEVVEDDGQGARLGDGPCGPGRHGPVQREPSGHGVGRAARTVRSFTDERGHRLRVLRRHPPGQVPQRLDPGPGGRGPVELGAASHDDLPSLAPQPLDRPPEQPGLADAGLAR